MPRINRLLQEETALPRFWQIGYRLPRVRPRPFQGVSRVAPRSVWQLLFLVISATRVLQQLESFPRRGALP